MVANPENNNKSSNAKSARQSTNPTSTNNKKKKKKKNNNNNKSIAAFFVSSVSTGSTGSIVRPPRRVSEATSTASLRVSNATKKRNATTTKTATTPSIVNLVTTTTSGSNDTATSTVLRRHRVVTPTYPNTDPTTTTSATTEILPCGIPYVSRKATIITYKTQQHRLYEQDILSLKDCLHSLKEKLHINDHLRNAGNDEARQKIVAAWRILKDFVNELYSTESDSGTHWKWVPKDLTAIPGVYVIVHSNGSYKIGQSEYNCISRVKEQDNVAFDNVLGLFATVGEC